MKLIILLAAVTLFNTSVMANTSNVSNISKKIGAKVAWALFAYENPCKASIKNARKYVKDSISPAPIYNPSMKKLSKRSCLNNYQIAQELVSFSKVTIDKSTLNVNEFDRRLDKVLLLAQNIRMSDRSSDYLSHTKRLYRKNELFNIILENGLVPPSSSFYPKFF